MSRGDRAFYALLYIGLPALFVGGMLLIGFANGWS